MPRPTPAKRNAVAGNSKYATYRLYGLNLASDFPFANRLAPGTGPAHLTFTCKPSAPLPDGWDRVAPAYASHPRADGSSAILLYKLDNCWVVRFKSSDFYLFSDHILCHLRDQALLYLAEIQLLGVVLACWLERRGIPALHASAVVLNGRAVAFLSVAGSGKSSIAASLTQAGYPLLTDDILAVEPGGDTYLGHPGYPQVRMWPEQAQHFLGYYKDLDIVHPAFSKRRVPVGRGGLGTFCEVSQPLAQLYLPERRNPSIWGTHVEIETVSRRDGFLALVGQSFIPDIVEAAGLQPRRLEFFASLVSQVAVRRVIYPDGYEHLPKVRSVILGDVA